LQGSLGVPKVSPNEIAVPTSIFAGAHTSSRLPEGCPTQAFVADAVRTVRHGAVLCRFSFALFYQYAWAERWLGFEQQIVENSAIWPYSVSHAVLRKFCFPRTLSPCCCLGLMV
jgi:hypothetical protein